jgi:hypothetical protein
MLCVTFFFVSCFDRKRVRAAHSNGFLPICAVVSACVLFVCNCTSADVCAVCWQMAGLLVFV